MITVLTAAQLLDIFKGAKQNLLINKSYVDELNVFPVPDGDTGTNMGLTITSTVNEASEKEGAGIPEIMYSLQPCFADKESKTTPLCTVALFNAGETFKELSVSSEDCGLKGEGYVFTEVWQGKEEGENAICVNLSPHESKLYYISIKR